MLEPIGIIHSPFKTKDECPFQSAYARGAIGHIEVFEKYETGLQDLESFSHIFMLYKFDEAGKIEMIRLPFLDDEPHGIFATRHPYRPNRIGLSIVKLIHRDRNMLEVEGIDVIDKTLLLDIKPYIPRFDCIDGATEGWITDKDWRPKPPGRE